MSASSNHPRAVFADTRYRAVRSAMGRSCSTYSRRRVAASGRPRTGPRVRFAAGIRLHTEGSVPGIVVASRLPFIVASMLPPSASNDQPVSSTRWLAPTASKGDLMAADGGDAEQTLAAFNDAGIYHD